MLRGYSGIWEQISEVIDILIMGIGFCLTAYLYDRKGVVFSNDYLSYFIIFLAYTLFWVLGTRIHVVYSSRRFMSVNREFKQMIKAHFFAFGLCLSLVLFYNPRLIENRFVFYFEIIILILTLGVHLMTRVVLQAWRKSGRNTRFVLILGSGPAAKMYLNTVKENPQSGYSVVGYLAPKKNGMEIPYLGDYQRLENVLKDQIIDLVVVTALLIDTTVKECLNQLDIMGKNVVILLDEIVAQVARCRPVDFGGLSMVAYDSYPKRPWHEFAKRVLDIILTAVGLMILSPLFILIAIAIKVTSKGPVFFSQDRVSVNGRIFKMYKFRSMIQNAEKIKENLVHLNEMSGPVFKIKNDPRVTPIGKFLRKTSLDELPQLWNVLIGDMSLVGPRPPLPSEVNLYNPKHRKRLAVRPGITCIWQVSGRNNVDFDEWMEMDAEYVNKWSLWLDIEILAKTLPVVLMGKGAS
ncbi:MAG: UDP-glucose:undecaprenyl-phosphate glucose-1-phosphate transferase [Candidatus Dichloromethanomonas elyunquensis]|nr:MAG: UDP-glucose:undecaprenyl-phosphate glucose-1-phosphate transferase [Candidatus Dichloromethanomonas elyunquensis]